MREIASVYISSYLRVSFDSFVTFDTSHSLLSVFSFISSPLVAGALSLFLP